MPQQQKQKQTEPQADTTPPSTDEKACLNPPAVNPRASFRRSISSLSRSKSLGHRTSRLSLRPNMTNIKHRLSHIFVSSDAPRYSFDQNAQYSSDSNLPITQLKSGKPDPYWRPLPFILDEADEKLLQFVKNERDLIDVVCDTTVIYHTNLPTLHKACKSNMPNEIEIIAPTLHSTTSVAHNSAYVSRINNEIILELKGLEPVKFYRAKPDCLFPVDCFTARKATNRNLFSNVEREKDLTIEYAWKHTSMVGKGGLKLVDLRDNEVLAYYIPLVGKSFAKVRLQGSGLASQRLVVSTILALKYRSFLAEWRRTSPEANFVAPKSVGSTRPSETETACEVVVNRHTLATAP